VAKGLGFMWNPDFSALADPETWVAAAGQIFFSLSVGFGVIINYASYLTRKDDVALSSATACTTNEFFEVCLGGMITIPAAFLFFGPAISGFTGSSFKLGFEALPNVFAEMPLGSLFGFLWFFMLFLAAITSSISMLQPVIAFLEEGFGLKRHASATLLGLITAMGTFYVVYFSKGLTALDTMDFWVGTVAIFVFGMILSVVYGWILGIDRGEASLHEGAHVRVPRFVQYVIKYVAPLYLGGIFVAFCIWNVPGYVESISKSGVAQFTILIMLTVFVFLLILVHIAGRRWDREGRFRAALAADTERGDAA
jgi:SNF family Na+-dependent transporter